MDDSEALEGENFPDYYVSEDEDKYNFDDDDDDNDEENIAQKGMLMVVMESVYLYVVMAS